MISLILGLTSFLRWYFFWGVDIVFKLLVFFSHVHSLYFIQLSGHLFDCVLGLFLNFVGLFLVVVEIFLHVLDSEGVGVYKILPGDDGKSSSNDEANSFANSNHIIKNRIANKKSFIS